MATLQSVPTLASNQPRLAPDPDEPVRPHARLAVLLPGFRKGAGTAADAGPAVAPAAGPAENGGRVGEGLLVCGWKEGMAELLADIVAVHAALGRPLAEIAVAGRLPPDEGERIAADGRLGRVRLVPGEPTEPGVLREAGVEDAQRALLLTAPDAVPRGQEADARNIMITMAINGINPALYKSVEIINPGFADHLGITRVEESIYTRSFQQMMLVQAALGTGVPSIVGALLDPARMRLQVVDLPPAARGGDFGACAAALGRQGCLLIGLVEHAGNSHQRKTEYLDTARNRPGVRQAVEHLLALKEVVSNYPRLNPGAGIRPGAHARGVVIAPVREA